MPYKQMCRRMQCWLSPQATLVLKKLQARYYLETGKRISRHELTGRLLEEACQRLAPALMLGENSAFDQVQHAAKANCELSVVNCE